MLSYIAVGVDLIEIAVVDRLANRYGERFLAQVYTPAEQAYCRRRATKLAAFFAAKEAVSKALGVGLAYMTPHGIEPWEVEIIANDPARPVLCLIGSAQSRAEALGLSAWSITLSLTQVYAMALVIAS
jgi:holo-[acyl-carrier protein] synthase